MSLSSLGRRVLAAATTAAPGAAAEAFVVGTQSRAEEWSEGHREEVAMSESQGMALRLIRDGRLGFVSTNRTDDEALRTLAAGAVSSAERTSRDLDLELPAPCASPGADDLDLLDTRLQSGGFKERADFLSNVEAKVRRRDPRLSKVLTASYRESQHGYCVLNSRGLEASMEGSTVSFSLACVAVQGGETQVGYGFQVVRHYSDLKPAWVIDQTIANTLALLGGDQVPSGRYDVLLDPFVAAEILELLADALRGDQVSKGKSFLASRVGESVASEGLSLVDDGRRRRGVGSSPFDAEGIPTQTTVVVQDGILKGFLYDSLAARKAGRQSTGNAGRGSYRGLPEPEATNLYIKPGTLEPEGMMKSIRSGILVHNVMGLHTVDTASGDYSLGLMGERIENGRRTHGVRGVTMAGNLLELMKSIEAVGNDLVFSGSLGSPTLWIRGVSIGGR